MNYYISDTHFGCKNAREGRTLEHDKILKSNWNSIVTNGDKVYVVGDIGREGTNRDNEYLCEMISTLKGKKILIQGNHEKVNDYRLRQLFDEIVPYKEIEDHIYGTSYRLVLSHYPILMWNGQHKGWIHLYGHVHNSAEYGIYQKCLGELNQYFAERRKAGDLSCPEAKAYNVGCMLYDYKPVTLQEIIEKNEGVKLVNPYDKKRR